MTISDTFIFADERYESKADDEDDDEMNIQKLSIHAPKKIVGRTDSNILGAIAGAYGGRITNIATTTATTTTTTATNKQSTTKKPSLTYNLTKNRASNETTCTFTVHPPHLAGPLSANNVACRGCFFSFRVVDVAEGTFATEFNSAKPELTADAILERLVNRVGDPDGFSAAECCVS